MLEDICQKFVGEVGKADEWHIVEGGGRIAQGARIA
jgi:hypothetical protein